MKCHPGRLLVLLALAFLASVGHARSEEGEDLSGWLDLDTRVDTMLGPWRAEGGETDFSLLLRTFYVFSEDSIMGASSADSISGMDVIDADVAFDAAGKHLSGRVSFDLAAPGGMLEDAWVRWSKSDRFAMRAGNLKPRVLFSNSVDPGKLLFQDRTYVGAVFDYWDPGVEFSGHYDQFDWWLSFTNGTSGIAPHHSYVFRGEWALNDAAWALQEGGRGAPRHMRVLLGVTHFIESYTPGFDKANGSAIDFCLTYGPYALHNEFLWIDNGGGGTTRGNGVPAITLAGNSNPWDVTLSRMYGEEWQAAYRYQTPDDIAGTDAHGFALHYYPERGPAAFVGEVVLHDADRGPEGTVFRLGVVVGQTRR